MAYPQKIENTNNFARWLTLLGWLAMLTFAFYSVTHMAGAADTFKALAAGRHHINFRLDTTDPFSQNSLKPGPTEEEIKNWPKPARWLAQKLDLETVKHLSPTGWINQNWLAGVVFYWLAYLSPIADADALSFNSLVYLKFTIYLLTTICVYCTARTLRTSPFLSAVFTCFALFVGRTFFSIRPADFTNLAAAALILILVLSTYRSAFYVWLLVPLTVVWCNLHGGFVYAFVAIAVFTLMHAVAILLPEQFLSIGLKRIIHCVAATLAALAAVIIFNPYHLTNITHTFTVTLGKNAARWRSSSEWHPAFDWSSTFGNSIPFLIMFIVCCMTVAIWAIVLLSASRLFRRTTKKKSDHFDTYSLPKIDLALLSITALTIYMALRHRRFIPIAAIVTCPLAAMLANQTLRTISAARNLIRKGILSVSPLSPRLKMSLAAAAGIFIVTFTIWCSLKFKRVYLDPWPPNASLNSVFIRMTGSAGKPFDACKFINQNNLNGTIFCYWTEGNFIALRQTPEPGTGRIPLQLFMDSRAQTAYPLEMQTLWADIMEAGPVARIAQQQRKPLTTADYDKIVAWLNEQLNKHNISTVLMPFDKWQTPFVIALERSGNWRLVYLDNGQKLFADVTTPQGKDLFDGIFTAKTLYPHQFQTDLITAYHMPISAKTDSQRIQILDSAIRAFELAPSSTALNIIIRAARFPQLKPRIDRFCTGFLNRFTREKNLCEAEDGYFNKLMAATTATAYLGNTAEQHGNFILAQSYNTKLKDLRNERQKLLETKTW